MFTVPTFGGFPIFGSGPIINFVSSPRAEQRNTFFGIDGEECLDGGKRGGITTATGTLVASSPTDLQSLVTGFAEMADGNAKPLVDTTGIVWNNVKLETFRTVGKSGSAVENGASKVWKAYEASFRHLI